MRFALFVRSLFVLGIAAAGSADRFAVAQEEAVAEAVADAVATAQPTGEVAAAKPSAPALRPLTVAVGLTDDGVLTGTLTDSTSLSIKTAFGAAEIPLSEVAGIRFPAAEDTSTTVVMLNGDSITGATDLKFVSIETAWGSAKINGQNVANMLFVPGLKWQSADALGGKRWGLIEVAAQPAVPNAAAAANVQPASGSRPAPRVIFGQ